MNLTLQQVVEVVFVYTERHITYLGLMGWEIPPIKNRYHIVRKVDAPETIHWRMVCILAALPSK